MSAIINDNTEVKLNMYTRDDVSHASAFLKTLSTSSYLKYGINSLKLVVHYTKEIDGEEVTDETIVTSNMSLYAHWETATPYIEATVTKSGTKLTIDAKVYNFVASYDILIVGYKDNKFVTMKRVPYNEQNSPYALECDIDKTKVMVWSDLSTLKPLCEAEEITSDKFIIE